MFEESLKEGKPRPNFAGTDAHQVTITLHGDMQNPQFIRFLERVSAEKQISFSVEDLLILDAISQGQKPDPAEAHDHLARLVEMGIVEKTGHGRGLKYVLSRKFYSFLGKTGAYTRKRGLDRETNKALLVQHIKDSADDGCALGELEQVLPALSTSQVQKLLQQLKADGKVRVAGRRRTGRWYPGRADV
jgi:ATP-dependent DNA helicase RecG